MTTNRKIAQELIKVAKELIAANNLISGRIKLHARQGTEMLTRNEDIMDAVTSDMPKLIKILKDALVNECKNAQIAVDGDLKREWSEFYAVQSPEDNNNKYHYYAIFSYTTGGEQKFIGVNCSGRIGYVERVFDLTMDKIGSHQDSYEGAMRAVSQHLKSKITGKGYQKMSLRVGKKK